MFDVCVRFTVFVLSCVKVEALRQADHPSEESYRLWMIKKLRNQPYAPKVGASSKSGSKLPNGSKEVQKIEIK
jgi:hypothetical protein